jgi:hypothetical protein
MPDVLHGIYMSIQPSRFERWILGLLPLVGEALIPVEPGVQIGRADALPDLLSSGRHDN